MSNVVLEARGLSKQFGGITAVRNFDISVDQGEIHALIGPNGSGKSTTINMVSGILKPTEGRLFFAGTDITAWGASQRAREGLARTFQLIELFPEMTVLENVLVGRFVHTRTSLPDVLFRWSVARKEEARNRERALELLDVLGLHSERDELARNLPYGKQRLTELARALATEPRMLLLDEPVAGMTAEEADQVVSALRRACSQGISVLLVEHVMRVVMSIANRVTVLNEGIKIAEGAPEEVVRNPEVITAYLGSNALREKGA